MSIRASIAIGVLCALTLAAEEATEADSPDIGWDSAPRRLTSATPDWWKLGVEIRGRLDTSTGIERIGRDTYYLHRLRLNSSITWRPWLKLFVQVQDARAADYDRRPVPATMQDPFDLRQAFAEFGKGEENRWTLRLGRQPLVFGDARLVSTSNWGNVGPTYDAARLTRSTNRSRLDLFSSLVVMPRDGFNKPRADRKLSGVYGNRQLPRMGLTVDVYTFWKSNLRSVDEGFHPGHLDVLTSGMRAAGKLPSGFDYNVEAAVQRGHVAADRLSAWTGHCEIGKRLRGTQQGPRVWLEHNYATGDRNLGDGRRQAFEQLYPTPWSVVGRAVDFASRNLHEPVMGMEWQLNRRWKFRGTARAFWVADTHDALYTLSGAVYARRVGAASSRAGEEAGAWAIYQLTRRVQLWAGYARLFSGPFLKEAGRGNQVHYPFAVWSYTL
ncbi:MAG: alginate export family protein [Bryobacterales bacterium]|nr:alginate export family protein [Bryobacterales bacterium]